MKNIILSTDSYKFSMWKQYPPETTYISSYIESRGGEDESVFFGLQAFIKEYLLNPITQVDIDVAEKFVTQHGLPFNREGWEYILKTHKGYLPISITAVPEGTAMGTHNVQVQVTNTDPNCAWLVSYLETAMLRGVWYPSTVATKSRKFKKLIAKALHETSDVPVNDQIFFKLHDFGARGASSGETAMLGGMGHLVNFMGTDTFESLVGVMRYYNAPGVVGYSIPASEHSTITSWGRENEVKAYENMINQFAGPGKLYACVSDSYNIYEAVSELWGTVLNEKLIKAGGTLVIRPDSGDPKTVPVKIIQIMMDKFGYTVNSKGYKVLPSYVRLIQGDGITEESLPVLLQNLKDAGISAENIAFGMGGGLLQAWNRDTLKYAMKASAIRIGNGPWQDVYKDPVDDKGKLSKKGRLALIKNGAGEFETVLEDWAGLFDNHLIEVFRDGKLLVDDTFEEIRARAKLDESEYV